MIEQPSPTSGNILIVDDERTNRQALAEVFNRLGHRAIPVASAEEAFQALAAAMYDVVILDLKMPGANGLTVLSAAEEIAPNTAFIVLTAYASTDTAIAALRYGAVDYLRKPSSLETIIEAVNRALDKSRQQKQQEKAVQLLEQALSGLRPSPFPNNPLTFSAAAPILQAAGIVVNQSNQTATYQGKLLDLTPIEYRLLRKFVARPDNVFTYAELAHESHGSELNEEKARVLLRTHLFRLSRKLGDMDNSPLQSVRGRGYILRSQE